MPARHAILGLLMQRPMHGYEIDNEFEAGLRKICHLNISQIYAYLKSMEKRGWVDCETVMQKNNPPKKVYSVTDAGREEMYRWLGNPVGEERQFREEFLTKLLFRALLSPQESEVLLAEQLQIYETHLAEVNQTIDQGGDLFTNILLDAAKRHAEADVAWLTEFLHHLRRGDDATGSNGSLDSDALAGID